MSESRRTAELADCPVSRVCGVPVHALTMDDALSIIDRTVERRGRLLVGAVNAAKIVNMRKNKALRDAVLDADMILADGIAVVWASRLLRRPLPERVTGVDLMHGMLQRGSARQRRVYFLGATDEVLRISVARVHELYPGIVVTGTRNGYYEDAEEPAIVAEIRAARADFLFVAMSPPKKEVFMARWFSELGVPVCHGVGGSLDVLAGKVQRAPQSWQRLGLEWLYRIKQEPRRMWRRYLVTNTLFCSMLLAELIRPARSGGDERYDEGRC